jgi:acetylglutamate kinase
VNKLGFLEKVALWFATGKTMAGRTIIKIGGNEIDNPTFLEQLVTLIKDMPVPPIIIHGDLQDQLGIKMEKIQGLRITDAKSLRVTEMVLSGLINKRLVKMLVMAGLKVIGLSGVDAHLFQAEKLSLDIGELGFVGTISKVNTQVIEELLLSGFMLVISPISLDLAGQVYNVNADSAAQALAENLKIGNLVFITDVPGVIIKGKVQDILSIREIDGYIQSNEIAGGMIPKVKAAIQAVQKGVGSVIITNAQNFIAGKGTKIKKI